MKKVCILWELFSSHCCCYVRCCLACYTNVLAISDKLIKSGTLVQKRTQRMRIIW